MGVKVKKCAIILCGGSGLRAGLGFNKVLFALGQKTVLETVLDKFKGFDKIVIAANKNDFKQIEKIGKIYGATVVLGGDTRTKSVKNALICLDEGDIVAIHDAARPFVSAELIEKTAISAIEFGSGVAAVKVIDSIKNVEKDIIGSPLNRDNLWAMQTPQTFKLKEIRDAYARVKGDFTDDAEVYRLAGYAPKIVEGEYTNKKLTVASDFFCCQNQLIGTGFDVHPLVFGRKLILGGVEIEFKKGLQGHSDADVLLHAITDALLSAGGLGDIGSLFPDSDARYKDIDSAILLKNAALRLGERGVKINYISAVIIAQAPKVAPFIPLMRQKIASVLQIEAQKINISATTTEFLGIIGRGQGIAASAVCLCE